VPWSCYRSPRHDHEAPGLWDGGFADWIVRRFHSFLGEDLGGGRGGVDGVGRGERGVKGAIQQGVSEGCCCGTAITAPVRRDVAGRVTRHSSSRRKQIQERRQM